MNATFVRACLAAALAVVSGCASAPTAVEGTGWVALDPPRVFDQLVHSTMSCGPAALATALVAEGGEPARAVLELGDDAIAVGVETYGTRTGRGGEQPRFDPASGVSPNDLLDWTNDWRDDLGAELHVGVFLDRRAGESDVELCVRVHALLLACIESGAAPLVRVRAFAPGWYPERGAYLWDGISAHWITILGVPRSLGGDGSGFAFDYADPDGGTIERGWIGAETQRDFAAARGDTSAWTWLESRPFLLVTAPGLESLGRARQPWFLRTIVTLDHAIVPGAALEGDWTRAAPVDAESDATTDRGADEVEPSGSPLDAPRP